MADLNACHFTGRLGRDPEVKHLPSGDAACNTSIAVGKRYKDKSSGEMVEQTTWVPLSFYGKTAELLGQYVKKGDQIRVSGEFVTRKYTTQGGEERTATEIKVLDLQLLGGQRRDGAAPAPAPAPARAPAPAQRQAAPGPDDDVPF